MPQAERADRELELRQTAEAAADEKLRRVMADTSAKYEAALAAMRAQLEQSQLALERERQEAKEIAAGFDAKLQTIIDGINTDYKNAVDEAAQEAETARAEVDGLTSRLRQAEADAERERQARTKATDEFDSKLQSIVANIATDYEHTIGEATLEKEAARAEVQNLTGKLQEAQALIERERAAREAADREWNAKLENIVAHLATDHEADLGEALLAKEEARAAVRSLQLKLTAMQKQAEEEREKLRLAAESWSRERGVLLDQIRATLPGKRANPSVLVVHSDAGMRAMARHTLEQAGYAVLTAADGLEGLRTASQQRPDVVVAEAVLPKMNGRELVQLLKARQETSSVKVVLMSAGTGSAEGGSDYRADQVITNGADLTGLRDTVATVLAR